MALKLAVEWGTAIDQLLPQEAMAALGAMQKLKRAEHGGL
jgi:hypothetical protein